MSPSTRLALTPMIEPTSSGSIRTLPLSLHSAARCRSKSFSPSVLQRVCHASFVYRVLMLHRPVWPDGGKPFRAGWPTPTRNGCDAATTPQEWGSSGVHGREREQRKSALGRGSEADNPALAARHVTRGHVRAILVGQRESAPDNRRDTGQFWERLIHERGIIPLHRLRLEQRNDVRATKELATVRQRRHRNLTLASPTKDRLVRDVRKLCGHLLSGHKLMVHIV